MSAEHGTSDAITDYRKPTLVRCPLRWQHRDGRDGGPCPAYLDNVNGDAVCVDHGVVGRFDA